MKKVKRTNKDTRINKRKKSAFSSLYSIASFLTSLVFLIVSIVFNKIVAGIIAFLLLLVTLIICEILVNRLGKAMEADDKRARQICNKLSDYSNLIGYLSYIQLAASLVAAMYN